jgi:hypothetical protein
MQIFKTLHMVQVKKVGWWWGRVVAKTLKNKIFEKKTFKTE